MTIVKRLVTIIGAAIFATSIGIASIVNAMEYNPKGYNHLIPNLKGMRLANSEYEDVTDKIPSAETLIKTYISKNTILNTFSIDDKIFAYEIKNRGKITYVLIDKDGKGVFTEKHNYDEIITYVPKWLIEKQVTPGIKEPSIQKDVKKQSTSTATTNIQIKGVTTVEIEKALSAAAIVEKHFKKSQQFKLTAEQEKLRQKMAMSIITTKNLLGSKEIVAFNQEPGKQITLESVHMSEPGFAIIENNRRVIGSSALLRTGTTNGVRIDLNEHVDGETITVRLYKDDGDGVYDPTKDKWMFNKNGRVKYKQIDIGTRRNLSYAFYSNYLSRGVPSLVLHEQLPGTIIKLSSIRFGYKNPPKTNFFIVIRKDRNGFPEKIIGVCKKLRGSGSDLEITLQVPVSNETLYAMVYQDNGNGTFNENEDIPLRGVDNLPIIAKFQVVR